MRDGSSQHKSFPLEHDWIYTGTKTNLASFRPASKVTLYAIYCVGFELRIVRMFCFFFYFPCPVHQEHQSHQQKKGNRF